MSVSDTASKFALDKVQEIANLETHGRLFRGERTCCQGPIRSRMAREWGLDTKGLADLQNTILREAQSCVAYNDKERLLAECQHLGIWTNTIDFTRSSTVGLWFACHEEDYDGQLRIVERSKLSATIIEPAVQHTRMANQRGVLVYAQNGEIAEDEIAETIRIPAEEKADLRQALAEKYGIARQTLFRDLEGFRFEIETREVRFVKAELAAGALAFQRGDYRQAVMFWERCVSSHKARRPTRNGGFANIVPLRNLAIGLYAVGQKAKAERTAEEALALAVKEASGYQDDRIVKETRRVYDQITKSSRWQSELTRLARELRTTGRLQ